MAGIGFRLQDAGQRPVEDVAGGDEGAQFMQLDQVVGVAVERRTEEDQPRHVERQEDEADHGRRQEKLRQRPAALPAAHPFTAPDPMRSV